MRARLEHSLGVAHLAKTLAQNFYSMQRHELDIHLDDVKCAEVAGARQLLLRGRLLHHYY
jgi:HD superfamily phosphohydrolase